MNLAQLYYFRTLAQYEHYGKAAEALYITQPSLSNSIKNLEKEIGVPFFERVGRIYQGTTYECLKGLEEGRYDVVFCGKLENLDNIEFVPQISQNVVLAVNSNHELAARESVSLADLKNVTLTSYRSTSYARTIFDAFFKEYDLEIREGFNDEISAASLVASDRSIVALILETLDDLALENFTTMPIEGLDHPFHIIYLAYNNKAFHSHLVEEFIKFTQRHIKFPAGVVPLEETYLKDRSALNRL